MSDELEDLDVATVRRLDLPKTATSPQGLFGLRLPKIVIPVYVTNSVDRVPHQLDRRAAAAITNAGAAFSSPIDKQRILFGLAINVTTSATAGTRAIVIDKRDKPTNITHIVDQRTQTASLTRNYTITPTSGATGVTGTIFITLTYPIVLAPEWFILVDDTSNIDGAGDTVSWTIEYVEVQI